MAKSKRYVMTEVFDSLCCQLGPRRDGGDSRVAKILQVSSKSVVNWRTGKRPVPDRVYQLLKLTLEDRMRVYRHMTGQYASLKFAASGARLSQSVGLFWGASANDEVDIFKISEQM